MFFGVVGGAERLICLKIRTDKKYKYFLGGRTVAPPPHKPPHTPPPQSYAYECVQVLHKYIHTYICIRTYIYICIFNYIYMCALLCAHMHTHMYTHYMQIKKNTALRFAT